MRDGLEALTPRCCRHGFATEMLRKRIDVKIVSRLGGWKDAVIVLKHHEHASDDDTLTEARTDTNLTHGKAVISLSALSGSEDFR